MPFMYIPKSMGRAYFLFPIDAMMDFLAIMNEDWTFYLFEVMSLFYITVGPILMTAILGVIMYDTYMNPKAYKLITDAIQQGRKITFG